MQPKVSAVHPLVKRLTQSNSLDAEFIDILKSISKEIRTTISEPFYVSIGKLLVQKISRLNSVQVKEKNIQTSLGVQKTTKEYSLDIMLEILVGISS